MLNNQDYTLTAIISANRFGQASIDVSNVVAELNIYENIKNPFLSGKISILDDNGISNAIKFKGTETLTITLSNEELGVAPITKIFIITQVSDSIKINDQSEMIVLSLVEPHLFYSRAVPISKTYNGTPDQIISKLITDDIINKTIDNRSGQSSVQSAMKVTFPYIEPLQAVELIRGRMTTTEGFPYVLYSTLHDDAIIMDNLGDALRRDTWNERTPFTYSQAGSGGNDTIGKLTSIEKFIRPNADDTLSTLLSGAVGSKFSAFDTMYGQEVYSNHHDINETIKSLVSDDEQGQSIFDEDFFIANQKINDINSRNIFQVVSSNAYEGYNGFNDEPIKPGLHKTKIQAKSILAAMDKNLMVIQIPGTLFLVHKKSSVGTRIKVQFASNNIEEAEDLSKSGDYLITAIRHVFRDNKHTVSATVTKLVEKRI